jgi:uncharacterized protein
MHRNFGLTLMVNHACNLRCTYCYTGDKFRRAMPFEVGRRAIDRAAHSLLPGGTLELGFFGGEPVIEADSIMAFISHARRRARDRRIDLVLQLTTNGTIETAAAWEVMLTQDLQLAISHDGLPEIHDRHRVTLEAQGTSARVLETIARLLDAGKEFRVVVVVRPDSVDSLRDGLEFLYNHGARHFDPSLDLWTTWTVADGERLKVAIRACAEFWANRLPDCSISWFDEKIARLSRVPTNETARCGFGHSEIAIAPSGNLYPCERLIGADEAGNPMRLSGHVLDGDDFFNYAPPPGKSAPECVECSINSICSTTCRCSNYVRTGIVGHPDRLLCLWDQCCVRETARVLNGRALAIA